MKVREKNMALFIAMNKAGYNSKLLSNVVGIHANSMCSILNKKVTPSKTTARKIAQALECPIRSIFPEVFYKGNYEVSRWRVF